MRDYWSFAVRTQPNLYSGSRILTNFLSLSFLFLDRPFGSAEFLWTLPTKGASGNSLVEFCDIAIIYVCVD